MHVCMYCMYVCMYVHQLAIIEKDLKRLPHPSVKGESTSPNDLTPALEERVTTLREILYIYAQEHPNMGYRQGMHEIASYLLFCLEQEHPKYPDNPLFTPIMPICFVLLETLLGQLHTAYDASGSTQSLQTMSHSILGKIHQNDPSLYQHLTSSPNIPPPPIYCTRWVRLLFSREVVGYENVFQLWDVFFEYKNVMRVLEVTSACRILLLRNELLNPEKNPLDLLMNVPQLSDISQLANVLRRLMQQKDADHPIQLPPSQILPTGSPVMSSQESPPHPPTGYPLMPAAHPLAGPRGGESPTNKFNLSKMRQTLGQKGESLRQKIITTTNEWKEAASRETSASGNSFTGFATNSDMIATATQAIRNNTGSTRPTETVLFSDPLMHPPPAQSPAPVRGNPPSPRQHLHEMWSQLLKQKIWTVQHFCMSIESNENGRTVPREVWEALADMDQMRHELHNYSLNMPG